MLFPADPGTLYATTELIAAVFWGMATVLGGVAAVV